MKKLSFEGRFESGLDKLVEGKVHAFVAVIGEHNPAALGVAIANERGYYPVPEHWSWADDLAEMQAHADELNAELGLSPRQAAEIEASSHRAA